MKDDCKSRPAFSSASEGYDQRMSPGRDFTQQLEWQSRLSLFLAISFGLAGIAANGVAFAALPPATIVLGFALGVLLALLSRSLRAANPAAAATGGLFTWALYLATPGWRTALWPLLVLLLLTLVATRFGRIRKEDFGVAEATHGRNAAQVAANLGVAVLSSVPLDLSRRLAHSQMLGSQVWKMALAAALAEAAADTLSSEFGEVLGGEPRLITSFHRVPAGTDGAISIAGTLAGSAGAVTVTVVAAAALSLKPSQAAIIVLAAIAGFLIDSLLGAVFEMRGWLNNDAVNFLSTLVAAMLAAALGIR